MFVKLNSQSALINIIVNGIQQMKASETKTTLKSVQCSAEFISHTEILKRK